MSLIPETPLEEIRSLNTYLVDLRRKHLPSMEYYKSEDGLGFYHQSSHKRTSSLSSSSTCITSLVRSGLWNEKFPPECTALIANNFIQRPWKSGDLNEGNPYSISFVIEGILSLFDACPGYDGATDHLRLLKGRAAPPLIQDLCIDGAISLEPYPASAYLTELAFRVLRRLGLTEPEYREISDKVHEWARHEINKQIVLISAKSQAADPLNLASALILITITAPVEKTSPEEKQIFQYGLSTFFACQNPDGSWPHSRPLFHSPRVGNAYVFEYELLTHLLLCRPLRASLLPYIQQFARAAYRLERLSFDLSPEAPGTVTGWASGHHPQIQGAESWSTACVYDFGYALAGLVSEAIRRTVFAELGALYWPPRRPLYSDSDSTKFASKMLDADLHDGEQKHSLRDVIAQTFVFPIARESAQVETGRSLSKTTPMSAIFFGPPGTSKTTLAKDISEYLGWPLLPVDPSYLVKDGLDRIQAMADRLFNLLTLTEQVVVLLDEFDEMGRARVNNEDLLSRFITTAMLPKLASLNVQRRIVFLLATNYISGFDAAFSRGGRFDMLVQVMPPNADEKLKHWPDLNSALEKLSPDRKSEAKSLLGDLTYLECEQLALSISKLFRNSTSVNVAEDQIFLAFTSSHKSCTLSQKNERSTWKQTCEIERKLVRIDRRRRI
jgi:ATPase family protein associated with various cellular activities (AAA)